jgi:hypothetical protein
LPDLFIKRHLAEQAIDTGLERWIGKLRIGRVRELCGMGRRSGRGCL